MSDHPVHILGLDTTSRYSSIAISKNADIIGEYNFASFNRLSASLIPAISFLLGNAGLKIQDIDAFGVSIGPGLFTGIQVGLSTLKGLLFENKKPLVPVVSLKALALKIYATEDPVIHSTSQKITFPIIDAKRDEVYLAGYRLSTAAGPGLDLEEFFSPQLLHISQLKKELKSALTSIQQEKGEIIFTGSGSEAYRETVAPAVENAHICQRSAFLAPEICKISYRHFLTQDASLTRDLQQLMPLYIRKPDAEQNLK